ncbi:peptidase M61 [Rufibacter quisquiliarum]|uniref:Putative metalloprotease with PDZ domain n=1 Tax=Rufibacter quisquiliarum TaxID=1549639 RepID=A0A839GY17_9BACT|nr:peptidase M61 [Rufibacter quisquiliarum]MBA9078591.1 putative metalloprotease with PDZ domain [Rufibacter quisquiliarum]
MMLKRSLAALGLAVLLQAPMQAQDKSAPTYRFSVDLGQVKGDKLQVSLLTPDFDKDEVVYHMPKMVPGTYAVYDFGKFIEDFAAYDKKGKKLDVERVDQNSWKIKKAKKLAKITYLVNDTWDTPKKEDIVFEPAATDIEEGKVFLINTHGFFGYFDGLTKEPYQIQVNKPKEFYGATSLRTVSSTPTSDTYRLANYNDLVDAPMLYSRPDTAMLKVGNAEVLISTYAAGGGQRSRNLAQSIKTILEAQKNYLGGTLPVDKYAFLIYIDNKQNRTGAYGALEHSYSSVYYFPEMPPAMLAEQVRNIAAHEFFHIVTPLNIHSEEIGNFDFSNPKMSKHLWMYEGATEYFAHHVQVNQKLTDLTGFLKEMRDKIIASKQQYNDDLAFTELSLGALDKYEKEYGNVYQKGALLNMALDIRLRELSGGKYGLRNLMKDLSRTYGKDVSFKDEELFDKIASLTYPEIRDFFRKHVEGNEPLPYAELFQKVGVTYQPSGVQKRISLGKPTLGYDQPSGHIIVASTENLTAFGKQLGYKVGDQLWQINGEDVTLRNATDLINKYVINGKEGEMLTLTVGRKDANGEVKPVKLQAKLVPAEETVSHLLTPDPNATAAQKALQQAWLYSGL